MVAKNGTAEKLDGGGGSGIGFPVSVQFSSVQFSRSVVSNSLRPHEQSELKVI